MKISTPFILAFALAFVACSNEQTSTPTEESFTKELQQVDVKRFYVRAQRPHDGSLSDGSEGPTVSGIVVSNQLARPSSKTGGLLTAVRFSEGDDVRRGQILAQLDDTEFASAVAQAEAGLVKARRDQQRVASLFADSVATRTQFDDTKTGVAIAEQELERIKFNRAQSAIIAPISGRILSKLANAGESIGPGMPIAIIQGTAETDWRVDVGLSDQAWAKVDRGQSATVRFDAYPGQAFPAQVSKKSTAANLQGGTFNVELKLLETRGISLAQGLVAEVAFEKAPKNSATSQSATQTKEQEASGSISIPLTALGSVAGKQAEVFIVKAGRAFAKTIHLGNINAERVQVLSGLASEDSIITTSVAWLRDGDPIQVVD